MSDDSDAETAAAVHDLLHGSPLLQLRAVRRLAARRTEAAVDLLSTMLSNQRLDRYARTEIARSLGQIGRGDAPQRLLAAIADPGTAVALAAARALGDVADRATVPQLLTVLRSGAPSARQSAATALRRLPDSRALPALLAAMDEPNPAVARAALYALAQIQRPEAQSAILCLLRSPRAELRAAAVEALDGPTALRAVAVLLELLHDCSAALRGSACDALARSSSRDAVLLLTEVLLNDPAGDVRFLAASALGRLADPRAIPALERAIVEDEGWFEPIGEPVSREAEEALRRIRGAAQKEH